RGQRVLVGRLGIGVDQDAGGREVARHAQGEAVGEALQLSTDAAVELTPGDLLRDRRTVVPGLLLGARLPLPVGGTRPVLARPTATGAAAAATRGGASSALRLPAAGTVRRTSTAVCHVTHSS